MGKRIGGLGPHTGIVTPIRPSATPWTKGSGQTPRGLLLDGVLALHSPITRYHFDGDDRSYSSPEEAMEAAGYERDDPEVDWDATLGTVHSFVICRECARIEREEAAVIGYKESLFPCRTARVARGEAT